MRSETLKDFIREYAVLFWFSEKLFRAQLAFHKDINYSEEVKFFPGFEVKPEEIKQFLIDVSIKI